jgi:hypothetical protein
MIHYRTIILLVTTCMSHAQVRGTWESAEKLATQMTYGVAPSATDDNLKEEYKILMVNDKQRIIGLQESGGGCVFIFPSSNRPVFFHVGDFVICAPCGASGNGKKISWEKAVLDKNKTTETVFVITLHRKNDARTDTVKLMRTKIGLTDAWDFGMMD